MFPSKPSATPTSWIPSGISTSAPVRNSSSPAERPPLPAVPPAPVRRRAERRGPPPARKFGIRAKALQQANNLSDEETTKLQIGHKLVIPAGSDAQAKAAPKGKAKTAKKSPAPRKAAPAADPAPVTAKPETETPPPLPPADNASVDPQPAALPPSAPAADPAAGNESSSFVMVGDAKTLDEFAAKHNTTTAELLKLNPRLDPAAPLKSGDMLFVPKK